MAADLCLSCAVPIKDERFFVDAGSSGAVTVNFLTPGSEIIPKEIWDSEREGMFCMSSDSFADFKQEIEELCSKTPCSYPVVQALQNFFARVKAAKGN